MKIAVSATQCNGKTSFMEDFLNQWSMYKTPDKTYRDIIEEKDLDLNQAGTVESQTIIRDSLVDQAIENSDEEFCIHDRCILDNLAYTLWLAEKEKIDDEKFIADSFNITRETLKFYDIILYLPIHPKSPINLEERKDRDLDLTYREEIDNIFKGIFDNYKNTTGLVFPLENSPAMIEIYGDNDMNEKLIMVSDYLDDEGNFKTTDESLMQTISQMAQEDSLTKSLLDQVSQ